MSNKTHKLVLTALMAALTCVATMVIKIPAPTGGYIHLGDGLVLLSGIILGPIYGGLAAGMGSMFADLFSGYAGYALATLIIKAVAAIVGGIVYRVIYIAFNKGKRLESKENQPSFIKITDKAIPLIIAGICLGVIVTGGYFYFEGYILGLGVGGALAGLPFNIAQNILGIIVAVLLMPVLSKIPIISNEE
jgi:uncharacterized membrane protein